MSYRKQLQKVVDYIGEQLDEQLSLEELAAVACLSKFHFHRAFTAYTGLSLKQYIRWLRLKRAAHQLVVNSREPIISIAISAGFESHEAFTRAFKKACGLSPNQFRTLLNWKAWDSAPYCLPQRSENTMKVEIKEMKIRRLAVVEHRGAPEKLGDSINQLISWIKDQTNSTSLTPGESFGFAYDDPNEIESEDFRFDLGITVPNSSKISGVVVEKNLPAGRYAVAVHKGSRENIGDTVYAMYRDWLPDSGETLGELPCIFCYYNFDHEVAATELLTECWLLLK